MKGTIELSTQRLVLRRYRMEDALPLYKSFGTDEKMYEYSGWNPYATQEMAAASVRQYIDSYQDPSFYGWAIELKQEMGSPADEAAGTSLSKPSETGSDPGTPSGGTDSILIGTVGTYDKSPETGSDPGTMSGGTDSTLIGTIGAYDYDPGAGTIEAGISICRDFWGKGIASEALARILVYLTEEEEIPCVKAWCAAPNIGSAKAMEKAGMRQSAFQPSSLKVGDAIYDRLVYEYRLPTDLTFRTRCGTFNYRVGAVIIHDGRLLLMKNEEEPYYYTVGGRVRFNETTEEAVIREVEEEIGVKLEIDRFLFFQEQFFDGKVTGTHIHELGVYYLMKDSPDLDRLTCNSVTARGVAEELLWIPVEEAGNYYIVPESVAAKLGNLPAHPEHIIEIDER